MLLTAKDIPFEVGKDNMAYYDAYLTGAKAQLKKVVEWEYEICTDHQDSYAIGMKRIDCPQCRQALLDEVKDG